MTMLAHLDQRRPANRMATPQRVKSGIIQRHCACGGTAGQDGECAACRAMRLARRPDVSSGAADAIPPMVHDVLRSPGRPLDTASRAFFEPRFGRDFSRVRVHADAPAAASARALNALAYTVGRDLVFDTGQFAPETAAGRRLLAHELTHVVQQDAGDVAPLPRRVGDAHDDDEREANAAMAELSEETETLWPAIQPASRARGIVQRFSTSEHIEIGNRAYEQAHAQIQPPSGSPLTIDADFVKELYLPAESAPGVASPPSLRYQRAGGGPAQTYGQLVAAADDFASFEQMDQREQNKSGVPVLGRIWDFIADKSRYVALAAENYEHFHPHNFLNWQSWHWQALRLMRAAWEKGQAANDLKSQGKSLLQQFEEHARKARAAIIAMDAPEGPGGSSTRRDELMTTASQEMAQMRRLLAPATDRLQRARALRDEANREALRAMAMNGFGDHFLTDAFAGGHIVTPRYDLLHNFTTKLLGFIPVEPVLHCANIPSLAWHDLDNKFGVQVDNKAGDRWLTFGDNYAHCSEADTCLPTGESLSPTMEHVVKATATSIGQVWNAAAGRMPTDLTPVLDQLPRPILTPGQYPRWTPDDWNKQLRYAAGEEVERSRDTRPTTDGSSAEAAGNLRIGDLSNFLPTSTAPEQVPNPQGTPLRGGPLSFRATCLNLLSKFSYDDFVLPMLDRIRMEKEQRFYYGGKGQIVSPSQAPQPQPGAVGPVKVGSIVGALAGVGLGLLTGGLVGAIVGGILGFLGGGLVGGLRGLLF